MKIARIVFPVLLLAGSPAGCGGPPNCTITPVLTVSDAKTGQALCNAVVVAYAEGGSADAGGSGVPFAPANDPSLGCAYYGNLPTPGPYVIDVSLTPYRSYSATGVRGIPAACDALVSPPVIKVSLQPG